MIDRLPALATWARWLVFGLLLAVPTSAAPVNIFGTLLILLALGSREFWSTLPRLRRNPVVLAALLLFALLIVGTLYSSGPSSEAWTVVRRYRKLLYLPFVLPFFQEERHRLQAVWAFCAAVTVVVLCSFTDWLGLTHLGDPRWGTPPGDSVFGSHITQGYMIALLIAFALTLARSALAPRQRLLWAGLAALGALDIALVMVGRTAKLILPLLLVWALWEWMRARALPRRTVLAVLLVVAAGVAGGLVLVARDPSTSLGTVVTQVEKSATTGERTSQGERVEFYRKSLALFLERPWTGHGTGSLQAETAKLASGASTDIGRMTTRNPHNEFIMWAVQLGLPGLLAFLAFCALVLRQSLRSQADSAVMLRGAWVVFTVGCLINSFLLDHLEGHAYLVLLAVLMPL